MNVRQLFDSWMMGSDILTSFLWIRHYNKQLEKEMLIQMQHASFINEETMIIIEASLETEFDWLETYGYIAAKVKKYKTNQHVFVQRVLEK